MKKLINITVKEQLHKALFHHRYLEWQDLDSDATKFQFSYSKIEFNSIENFGSQNFGGKCPPGPPTADAHGGHLTERLIMTDEFFATLYNVTYSVFSETIEVGELHTIKAQSFASTVMFWRHDL